MHDTFRYEISSYLFVHDYEQYMIVWQRTSFNLSDAIRQSIFRHFNYRGSFKKYVKLWTYTGNIRQQYTCALWDCLFYVICEILRQPCKNPVSATWRTRVSVCTSTPCLAQLKTVKEYFQFCNAAPVETKFGEETMVNDILSKLERLFGMMGAD